MRRWRRLVLLAGLLAPSLSLADEPGAWVVDGSSGCRVWNPEPQPGERVLWDGPCRDGVASGEGWLQWFRDGRPIGQFVGAMRDGREGDAGTWVWDDGTRFEGMLRDGSRDGPGSAIEPDGSQFEGTWRGSRYEGSGRLLMTNGDFYEGEFHDDAYDGIGVLQGADGGRYEGRFADGLFEGGGILLFADGTRYAGNFLAGKPDGRGTLIFPGGARYDGEFRAGLFDGSGTLSDPEGASAAGLWQGGCLSNGDSVRAIGTTEEACGLASKPVPDGNHVFVAPDGTRYDGTFRRGRLDGMGAMVRLNGSRWAGRFAEGALVEGVAELVFDDGVRLEAEYSDGLVVRARKRWPDGRVYEGGLHEGREHGFGREQAPDGTFYEGEFADGRPHGAGVRRLADGTLQAGEWTNGCLVTPGEVVAIRTPLAACGLADVHDGHGTIVFANGSRYEGAVENGAPQGQGKWTSSDGSTAEGFFRGASLEGLGVVQDARGTRYVGELRGNRPNGRGTLTSPRGLSFSGPWRDGCLQGHGLEVWFLTTADSCGLR